MIRVLIIEDNEQDILNIQSALRHSGAESYLEPFSFQTARTLSQGLHLLTTEKFDVLLLDLGLPDVKHFEGIDLVKKVSPLLPIIVLTHLSEEPLIAIETINRGAQDYFSKDRLSDAYTFEKVVRYAIERKKNEEALIRASKAKSEFLSSMSHDIRTPLNSIIGVAELLSTANLSEEHKNYVQMLKRASDNLLILINDVLDLSRIESGQMQLNKKPFEILAVVDPVLDIISTRAHAKGLEINFSIGSDVPRRVVGDPTCLNQILINLLGNAVKFTKTGEVTLDISTTENRDELAFVVSDTGIGIPEDKLGVIFDSFTQVNQNEDGYKRQGSGLGLAICKRITDLMGGKIDVTSKANSGSRFRVFLTLSSAPSIKKSNVDLSGIDVLVVDDNQAHAATIGETLKEWGAAVCIAQTHEEATSIAAKKRTRDEKFGLGILDLRMPGLSAGGLELVPKVNDVIGTIIMMLPTNHRHGDIERLKAAGVDYYYFKPTKPDRLSKVITCILRGEKYPSQIETEPVANDLPPLRIMVVDDSEDNRHLIEAFCKGCGFSLEMAEDGRQAFEKFKTNDFNLVLMDLQMPRMNGYEALTAIRNWEKETNHNKVPILALTAFALKEESEKCLAAGFQAHITKPITKANLLEAIRRYSTL